MRPAKAIAVYAVAVILLGSLLAPWLFWFVQWLAANFDVAAGLARHPFRRVFNRSLMIVALVGLWPLLRNLGFRSWAEVGYGRSPRWGRELLTGYLLGLASLAVAVIAVVALGRRELAAPEAWAILGKLFIVGIVVALIEETFFRGAIQGALRRGLSRWPALVISAVIYSALHFLKPLKFKLAPDEVTVGSGFDALGRILTQSLASEGVLIGFVSLFLAGLILGWTFEKTGRLAWAIGLHAGWVLANEFTRELGGGKVIQEPVTWLALLALWWLVNRWLPAPPLASAQNDADTGSRIKTDR